MFDRRHVWLVGIFTFVLMGFAPADPVDPLSHGKATGGVGFVSARGFDTHLSFTAQGHPSEAKGQVVFKDGFEFHGVVTCYFQTGSLARFSGTFKRGGFEDHTHFRITVFDGGEPGSSGDLVSTVTGYDGLENCRSGRNPTTPVTSGNLQVHRS